MFKSISLLLSASLALGSIPRASANPALIPAAPAICATGVGCVLLGTVVVGGTVAYLWQNGGQRFVANKVGTILRILDDPEGEPEGTWEDPLDTRDYKKAEQICRARANRMGATYDIIRDPATKKLICRFRGGSGR